MRIIEKQDLTQAMKEYYDEKHKGKDYVVHELDMNDILLLFGGHKTPVATQSHPRLEG